MTSYIQASSPTGNNQRIKLLGTDLIFGGIDNVFVYPSLNVDQLKNALSQTLSFWPILTGRIIVDNDNNEYFIECSDNAIPFTYTENDQLDQWPTLPVLVDDMTFLQPFIDSTQYKPEIEPLLRLKITYLIQSGEYVLGTSFFHMVGDADSNIHFLNDLSQIYQQLEPILPRPICKRHLLNDEDREFSLLPVLKLYRNTDKREAIIARLGQEYGETDPVNLSFSSQQLEQLRKRTNNEQITIHDALCAYLIVTLNKYFFVYKDEYIRRAYTYINYRGVTDSIASRAYVANAIMQPLTEDFPDPLSLSSIAKTIRELIKTTRQEDFLQKWITSSDILMRKFIKDGDVNFVWDKNEVIFNSNSKYDWTNQVNFGMKNQCRFHTMGLFKFYFRIFQLNPVKDEQGNWIKDNGGLEVAFRMPKGEPKEAFLEALKKDLEENFLNVQ